MPTTNKRRLRITRDLILFLIGISGIIWQTVVDDVDRPYLLAVFVACVGLPTYLASAPKVTLDQFKPKEPRGNND